MKSQLEEEIGKRQSYLSHTARDVELHRRLNGPRIVSASLPRRPHVDALLLDQKTVDDLVESEPIGRAMSPIRAAFTRSRSPFRGHRALPHSPPVPLRSAVHK